VEQRLLVDARFELGRMKPSPVLLLQSTIEKISIEANVDFDPEDTSGGDDVELQVREVCEPFPDFWQGQTAPDETIHERTFVVRLAIRSDPDKAAAIPYPFELIFSGVVAAPPSLNQFTPVQAARQYGFAMVYGAMREQFLTMTSRMPYGARLLPTASFMEPDAAPTSTVQAIADSAPDRASSR